MLYIWGNCGKEMPRLVHLDENKTNIPDKSQAPSSHVFLGTCLAPNQSYFTNNNRIHPIKKSFQGEN